METLDLSDFFRTKSQASDFSARLATILEETYKTGFNLEKSLMDHFGIEKKDKFMTLLRDNNVSVDNMNVFKEFVTKIQETITKIPLLPIVIAFEPKEQTLKTLSDWFFLNMKKQVLFDIKVDKNLLGGAAITYNGKFMDFSVKSKFDQIVKNVIEKPAPIPQVPAVHQNIQDLHLGR